MASIKYGGGVIQMAGSIAGTVHARNRSGNYVRARTKPVNPRSPQQQICRSIISFLTERWHDTLTPTQRAAWETYAAAVTVKNKLGETIHLTGFNMFVRYNSLYYRQTNTCIDDGPTTLTLPEKDSTLSFVAKVSDQTLNVAYNASAPWQSITGSMMVIFMGRPQNVTRNYFAGPWKLAGGIAIGQANPKVIAAPMPLILGQKVTIYARIVTGPTDGRVSEPFTSSVTVTA